MIKDVIMREITRVGARQTALKKGDTGGDF
jgi:hypothetical protein